MTHAPSILFADDSRSIRQMVVKSLNAVGYNITQAENGQEALQIAKGHQFDLILTDYNMPLLDGVHFTRSVRSLPIHRTTPILFVTTESQLAKKEQAKAAGANGWITKPFQPERLVEVIAHVMKRYERA